MLLIVIYFLWLFQPILTDSNELKPIIQEISLPKNVKSNQILRLNCALVQGFQPLTFEWFHNNEKLQNNNKTTIKIRDDSADLIIKPPLTVDDLGDYTCEVKNPYGQDTQKLSYYTNVKPKFVKELKDLTVGLLEQVEIDCNVSAHPEPEIEWFKLNENNLGRSDALKVPMTSKRFKSSKILKLTVTKETAGSYVCKANNVLGSIEKVISLKYFEDKPVISELLTASKLVEGKKYFLTCHISNGDKVPNVFEWFLNGQKIIPNENIDINQLDDYSKLNIKSMSLNENGDYTCKVKNKFGDDSRTVSIKLNAKPKWTHEPNDIRTKLNSIFSTKCMATGFPVPKIKWVKLTENGSSEKTIQDYQLKFNFTKSDGKLWKCVAENELGKIEKVIRISYFGNVSC